jgi:hypothetical protein
MRLKIVFRGSLKSERSAGDLPMGNHGKSEWRVANSEFARHARASGHPVITMGPDGYWIARLRGR